MPKPSHHERVFASSAGHPALGSRLCDASNTGGRRGTPGEHTCLFAALPTFDIVWGGRAETGGMRVYGSGSGVQGKMGPGSRCQPGTSLQLSGLTHTCSAKFLLKASTGLSGTWIWMLDKCPRSSVLLSFSSLPPPHAQARAWCVPPGEAGCAPRANDPLVPSFS